MVLNDTVTMEAPQLPLHSSETEIPDLSQTLNKTKTVLDQWTLDLCDPIARQAGFADYMPTRMWAMYSWAL